MEVSVKSNKEILKMYGAYYYDKKDLLHVSGPDDLYSYEVYGKIDLLRISSNSMVYALTKDGFIRECGPASLTNVSFATVIHGYRPPTAFRAADRLDTNLPYVNGCSTEQIFPPIRVGDPTMQLLYMPPHTSEQSHHIHSTVRAVYVLSGKGRSIVGTSEATAITDLVPGRICVLEKMCPHHFDTAEESLTVIPVHVFSSIGGGEHNHPMFNGTYMTDK
tara:strand:- start:2201 stop:2857 length:657 start_codon:yes stop_codon:yes gene_type:complete